VLLSSHFALLDVTAQHNAVHLQSLEQTLQQVQTRYDEIMRKEDKRLKTKAKKQRKRTALELGTAKSIELAAAVVMDELHRVRDALTLEGTVGLF
jgi:hypothetical protein